MEISNDYIDMIVNTLKGKTQSRLDSVADISKVISVLESIKLDDNGNMPLDNSLGSPITEERRQNIYDHCMEKANRIIDTE